MILSLFSSSLSLSPSQTRAHTHKHSFWCLGCRYHRQHTHSLLLPHAGLARTLTHATHLVLISGFLSLLPLFLSLSLSLSLSVRVQKRTEDKGDCSQFYGLLKKKQRTLVVSVKNLGPAEREGGGGGWLVQHNPSIFCLQMGPNERPSASKNITENGYLL